MGRGWGEARHFTLRGHPSLASLHKATPSLSPTSSWSSAGRLALTCCAGAATSGRGQRDPRRGAGHAGPHSPAGAHGPPGGGGLSAVGVGRGWKGVSWPIATACHHHHHHCPRVEPTAPQLPTGLAVPAPGAPAPGPSQPRHSPGSWGVDEGRGYSNMLASLCPQFHAPFPLERTTETHLQRTVKSLSSSRACSRSCPSSCSASTHSTSSGSSGTSAPASSGLQKGHHQSTEDPWSPCPVPALLVAPASPAWLQRGQ